MAAASVHGSSGERSLIGMTVRSESWAGLVAFAAGGDGGVGDLGVFQGAQGAVEEGVGDAFVPAGGDYRDPQAGAVGRQFRRAALHPAPPPTPTPLAGTPLA